MKGAKFKATGSNFFDRQAVIDAVDRATYKVLIRFGALVRKRAQASLKYAKDSSAPGSPPHVHKTKKITTTSRSTGKSRRRTVSPLREFLFFGYDEHTKSVVIGPERTEGVTDPGAPRRLEYGGTIPGGSRTISVKRKPGRDAQGRFVSTGVDTLVKTTGAIKIKPRPFMNPAFDAEKPGLAAMWKDSVK